MNSTLSDPAAAQIGRARALPGGARGEIEIEPSGGESSVLWKDRILRNVGPKPFSISALSCYNSTAASAW